METKISSLSREKEYVYSLNIFAFIIEDITIKRNKENCLNRSNSEHHLCCESIKKASTEFCFNFDEKTVLQPNTISIVILRRK